MLKSRFKKIAAATIACSVLFSMSACGGGDTAKEPTNIIINNASVYTVDQDRTTATALVIKDGKIEYVGDDNGTEGYKDDNSKVIDMKGNTVMPSMVDSHMHPAQSALSYYFEIGLQDVMTVDDYQKSISDFVKKHPDHEVYTGSGYMRSLFDEVGPRKETLDKVVSDKPVILTSADGHSVWVNSKTLELANITKESKDPANGVIQRDPKTGEPSGLLQEAAMNLVEDLKPEYTKDQYKEAIAWLQGWLNERGITTVFDAMVPLNNENYYMAYQEMAKDGELTVRVRGAWHLAPEMGSQKKLLEMVDDGIEKSKEFDTDYFQINAFKFFADQVLEEKTAYLSRDYKTGKPGWKGMKTWDDGTMEALFKKIDKAGYQIHVHQIGDEAASYTLDALEKTQEVNGVRDARHSFAHVQFLKDKDIKRMADLKINAIIAPYWMAMDDYYWDLYIPYIGKDLADNMYPAQSLVDAGINVATHSDFFVTEPELGWLLYGAVTRTLPQKIFDQWYEGMDYIRTADPKAKVTEYLIGALKPHDERMTINEAIEAATYNGAYANFMEDEIGSIEKGKKADLVMLDMNIFKSDIEDVSNVTPIGTIFDGKLVYEKDAEK